MQVKSLKTEQNINSKRFALSNGTYKVLIALWIIIFGLIPPLFSVWMLRRTQARTQADLRRAINAELRVRIQQSATNSAVPDRYYLEGVGYLIGDISCRFNARSGYIRCAVNPQGPCENCRHYEPIAK